MKRGDEWPPEWCRGLEAIGEVMAEGLFVVTRAGEIVYASQSAAGLLDVERDALVRPVSEYASLGVEWARKGEPLPLSDFPLSRVLRGEEFAGLELSVVAARGRRRLLEWSGRQVRVGLGEPPGAVVVARDISEERRWGAYWRVVDAVARELAREMDLRAAIDRVLDEIVDVVGPDALVGVWLADEAKQELELLVQRGLRPRTVKMLERVSFGAPLVTARAAATGEMQFIEDVKKLPRSLTMAYQIAEREDLKSYASFPLKAEGRLEGVLTVGLRAPRSFEPEDIRVLGAIADVLADLIRRARIRPEAEAKRSQEPDLDPQCESESQRLAAIISVVGTLAATMDEEDMYRMVTAGVRRLLNAERASIATVENDDVVRVLAVDADKPSSLAAGTRLRSEKSVVLKAVRQRKPILRQDLSSILPAERLYEEKVLVKEGLRSCMCIPIVARGRVLGTLDVSSRQPGYFGEDEVEAVRPITEQLGLALENARLLRESRQRASELEEERKRQQTFLSVVAHELKGLMTPILGYAQMLSKFETMAPEARAKATTTIVQQTRRLNRVVNDLLDVSRLQAGRFEIKRAPVDVVEVAREVVEAERMTTTIHRLELQAPNELKHLCDRDRLAQAIDNLVSNAIKYSPEGGEVRVVVRRANNAVQVSVADRGVGIAPEHIPMLFQPYARLYRERRTKGLGLGLYITRGIVEAHGGSITVVSKPGKGSTFTITLPLRGSTGAGG